MSIPRHWLARRGPQASPRPSNRNTPPATPHDGSSRENAEIAAILETGKHVAVFPEGTTTDGFSLLHFHAALIQPALAAGRPVLPVSLSYWEADGTRSLAPRYDGDISLGECMRALLSRQRLKARLVVSPPCVGADRKAVAAAAREAIARSAQLPLT